MPQLPELDGEQKVSLVNDDVQKLIFWMRKVGWANWYFGLINICFYTTGYDTDESVLTTGILSVCMYGLVRAKISYLHAAKNWVEISVTAVCGLYLPSFTLLLTFLNLVGLIGN
ncbi:MAG: hypothetical protein EBV03_04950 [Proteobacteria bacterium]|nr:hypothetical protein [Pseudomonadota bacterium]